MEDQHRAQQKFMRMRQEHAPKEPQKGPLPFSMPPLSESDLEDQRLCNLHSELQHRLEALELEEHQDHVDEEGRSPSGSSVGGSPSGHHAARRQYLGGDIPEASRALTEALMGSEFAEEFNSLPPEFNETADAAEQETEEQLEPEVPEAQNGVQKDEKEEAGLIMKACEAIDAREIQNFAGSDQYLCYENVVQRARTSLEMVGDAALHL